MLINPSFMADIPTLMYWHIGRRIFEEEQQGRDRAEYRKCLIRYLSAQLKPEFGNGFSVRRLQMYENDYDLTEKAPHKNPTIGIRLCATKNDSILKYSLPEGSARIFASRYSLYLPQRNNRPTKYRRN